jgi:hypothetical protein
MVLTKSGLVYSEYKQTIKTLKVTLRENMADAIATFRVLAGTATLAGISHSPVDFTATQTLTSDRDRPVLAPPLSADSPANTTLSDLLTALNTFSQATMQYLGTHVVANYWKSTRPDNEWLTQFQIERSGQFSLSNATPESLQHPVSPQELLWIQEWVAAFITRCSQVIRDFSSLINQKVLTSEQKALLLG